MDIDWHAERADLGALSLIDGTDANVDETALAFGPVWPACARR